MKILLSKQILMLLSFVFLFLNTCMAESNSQWKSVNSKIDKKDCVDCYANLDFNKKTPKVTKSKEETVYAFNDTASEPKTYSNNGYTYKMTASDTSTSSTNRKALEFNDKVYLKKKKKNTIKKAYDTTSIAIQVGAFRHYRGAKKYVKKYAILSSKYKVTIKTGAKDQKPLYRVRIEGFSSRSKAEEFKRKYGLVGAFLVMK